MKYTYRVVCYIDVEAEDEDTAIELAEEQFPVEPYEIDLYEVDKEDYQAEFDYMMESPLKELRNL